MTRPCRFVGVLPDIHVPLHDEKSLGAVCDYAADVWWDEVVILGDFLDMDFASKFAEGMVRQRAGKTFRKDADAGQHVLDQILAAFRKKNKNAAATLLEGNHEYRIQRVLDANPEYEGLIEVPELLRLSERGVKWVPFWSTGEMYRTGKLRYIHGRWTNKYHAQKHVDMMGCNVAYGHTHDVQQFSKELMGDDKTTSAWSLGCLCLYKQPYLRGAPTRWQHAFGEAWVMPNGYFNLHVTRIFQHSFIGLRNPVKVYKR